MDKDFYISTYISISKVVWTLLLITIVMEVYLVQRCFEINSNLQEKILDLDEPSSEDPVTLGNILGTDPRGGQMEPLGFKINYGTLSILWPIVLFSFFLVISYSFANRVHILTELKARFGDFDISSLRLDIFSLSFNRKLDQSMFSILIFYIFPFIGLLFHGYSGYYMNALIKNSIALQTNGISPENRTIIGQLTTVFTTQTVVSLCFMAVIFLVNSKSSRNYRISVSMLRPH